MKTALLCCTVMVVATAGASSAASPTLPARGSVSAATRSQEQVLAARVVPLRVQRLIKRRAPRAAYVPTRLFPGYTYFGYENLNRTGFDLFFTCCADNRPLIGFDAVLGKRSELPCDQGPPVKAFRIGGIVVGWNAGHNVQQAWRCIRRGGTRLLLTVSGEAQHNGTTWRTPRQLAQMVASARPIR
jgi:hypothetical protein